MELKIKKLLSVFLAVLILSVSVQAVFAEETGDEETDSDQSYSDDSGEDTADGDSDYTEDDTASDPSIPPFSKEASDEGFTYEFDHTSKSLYMVSLDNGHTVYGLNAHERMPMASITKIMTYIVAYENIPDIENTVITVGQEVEDELSGTGSSMSGILVGEQLTGLQLLNMMMIPSGNDAALALAYYVDKLAAEGKVNADIPEDQSSGSAFIDLMNKKAAELGCNDTHFVNPHGLYDPEHYSTARDLAVISQYALTLPYFADITSSTSYTLPATNVYDEERSVYTTNEMLVESSEYNYMYATGIKTGSLNEAGYCIVASALYKGYSYLVVALGSPYLDPDGEDYNYHGGMVDAANLFRWAFTQLEVKTIAAKGDLLADVNLKYAWDKDKLQVVAAESVSSILPSDVSVSSVTVTVDLPESIQAPVKKGDVVGTAVFSYANEEIARTSLVAAESVDRSEIVQTVETSKAVVTSPWFLMIACAIAVVLVFYIIIIILYNRKKKKMKRVKKYRDM